MPKKTAKEVGVKVVCRFRPIAPEKHLKNSKEHKFEILDGKEVLLAGGSRKERTYPLDIIFNDETTQEDMFDHVGKPLIEDLVHGFNGTIFVYGQTGSGKTHSLFGDMSSLDAEQRGIVPRSCQFLFEHFAVVEDVEEVTIKCSFVEIYLERLQDLLMPDSGKKLKIRTNPDKSVYVENIHEEYVSSFAEIYELMQIGFRNRVVSSTKMNAVSSRSHCVLIVKVKQILKGGTVKESKVNFADLAGSEKVKKTGASGDLLEQAKAINQSLSALGNVISALTSAGKKGKHIPYRDSTLTFLLQDALGGNTKTTLLVAASSDVYNFDETVGTIRFATRAKEIKCSAKVNKEVSNKELKVMIKMYQKQLAAANEMIKKMKNKMKKMKASGNVSSGSESSEADSVEEAKATNKKTSSGLDANQIEIDIRHDSVASAHAGEQFQDLVDELNGTIESKDGIIEDLRNQINALKGQQYSSVMKEERLKRKADEMETRLSNADVEAISMVVKRMSSVIDPSDLASIREEQEDGVRDSLQQSMGPRMSHIAVQDGMEEVIDELAGKLKQARAKNAELEKEKVLLLLEIEDQTKKLDILEENTGNEIMMLMEEAEHGMKGDDIKMPILSGYSGDKQIAMDIRRHKHLIGQSAHIVESMQKAWKKLDTFKRSKSRAMATNGLITIRALCLRLEEVAKDLKDSSKFNRKSMSESDFSTRAELIVKNDDLIETMIAMKGDWKEKRRELMIPDAAELGKIGIITSQSGMCKRDRMATFQKRENEKKGNTKIVKPVTKGKNSALKRGRKKHYALDEQQLGISLLRKGYDKRAETHMMLSKQEKVLKDDGEYEDRDYAVQVTEGAYPRDAHYGMVQWIVTKLGDIA